MLPFYKKAVFDLPDGPKNLAALFPAIDWNQVDEYYVTLKTTADAPLVTTPVNKMGCCCNDDVVRLHFENELGRLDAVNFDQVNIIQETTSDMYKRPLPKPFSKTDFSNERSNVKSNKTFELTTTCYPESAQPWLKELAKSTKVYMEWKGTEGQPDSFIPVMVVDGKSNVKVQDAFLYPFTIQIRLSNEAIIQRN